MTFRLLVVTGSRALSRTPGARLWAFAQLTAAMLAHRAPTVAHGACEDSPDEWADEIAASVGLTRVVWPLDGTPVVVAAGTSRPMRFAEGYPYAKPLERNEAMALWAGTQLRASGYDVRALALRCDWPLRNGARATQGTAHCRDRLIEALGAERVTDLVCPKEFGP